ncbi:pyridoxal phosphate-dependent aminotransferase [Anaerolineae bacterium CFX9]|nr:pyridoxal phosphate-dependent aminotransferase [Anaerolineae bacterium CFX9]
MTSQTKTTILQRHSENALLNAAILSPTIRNERDLSADELYAPLDEAIIATAVEALESGQTHYVDVPGIPPLRQALAEYLNASAGTSLQSSNVIVTAGVQESRFLTIQMVGEQFDRIGVPSVVHPGVKKAIGVRPKPIDWIEVDSATLLPTPDAIRSVLASGTRLLYLESPSRLTGAAYDSAAVAAIAALAGEFEATVIWDQGLAPWASSYHSLGASAAERTLLIGEAFPGMGLSSWFIGYIAAPEALIPPMQSQKQIMAICTSTPSQYAALEASKHFGERAASSVQRLSARRQQIAASASGTVIPGDAAVVLALRFPAGEKAAALSRLNAAGYPVADGADFGAPDVIRLTISHSDAAEAAVRALKG